MDEIYDYSYTRNNMIFSFGHSLFEYFNNLFHKVYNKVFLSNSKLLSDHRYIDVTSLEYVESGQDFNNAKGICLSDEDRLHFSNWLNYTYNLKTIKPESKCSMNLDKTKVTLVHYTHDNKEFTMKLDNNFGTDKHTNYFNTNGLKSTISRGIINAFISKGSTAEDITDDLKRFMGPNSDFYKSIFKNNNSLAIDLNHILHHLDLDYWDKITIADTFGDQITLDLKKTKILDWNPDFTI